MIEDEIEYPKIPINIDGELRMVSVLSGGNPGIFYADEPCSHKKISMIHLEDETYALRIYLESDSFEESLEIPFVSPEADRYGCIDKQRAFLEIKSSNLQDMVHGYVEYNSDLNSVLLEGRTQQEDISIFLDSSLPQN